ncbi:MAG: cytochrome C biogenesis protein [Rhodospirillaceae bacterium TMED8]|nr:cytochrome C biogenesis protein [Magnetovibrio sp.]OUT47821.1 MAG: cytochrome C biogenesis protein [Rhodospirillaceae bacterium TMED8]|tara:strand:+ start:2936 stop:3679 length:744 start_codon:yes stop_codon:yes gene_type:complete
MGGIDISFAGALGAGLLSFLSPCVLPLVPPYLCFLGGVTLAQVTGCEAINSAVMRRVFLSALFFVLGFSTIFVILGATASTLSQFLADYFDLLAQIAGVIIILLGLHFLGFLKIPLLYREVRFHAQVKPAGFIGAYFIGLAFAFGWTPCVGPILASILFIAGSEDSVFYGISLLGTYSLGLGIPFLFAAFAVRPFLGFIQRFRRHMQSVEWGIGILLVSTGALFLTGGFSEIAYWLLEIFPGLATFG